MFGPPVPPSGPERANILIVGEAPGEEESRHGRPFIGTSGRELRAQLTLAGIDIDTCRLTNVFNVMPRDNNVALFGVSERQQSPNPIPLTTAPTSFISPEHVGHLQRLVDEIQACQPNIILALGNTACWALLGQQGIGNLRGVIYPDGLHLPRSYKILPTFHPAAVLRQYPLRVVAISDMEKAYSESFRPEIIYDNCELWMAPTIQDMMEFGRRFLEHTPIISTDIETRKGQITCIGFAPASRTHAIVIPFWRDGPEPNYWPTVKEERIARRWVGRWIENSTPKVLQNGVYDAQYMIAEGYKPRAFIHDTMLAHHSKFSELQKGLGFLGSTYGNWQNWKLAHRHRAKDPIKREE